MQILTALAAIGGFLFGYDTGVISGAMPPITRTFDLTNVQQEVVVSSTVLAAFISSLVGGTMNKKYGRKFTILSASLIFTIGAFLMGMAWSYNTLVLGRIVIGGGIGLASLSTPIYLAEVASPTMRGTLVTVNGLLICFGQFSAGMIDGIFDEISPTDGWRFMLGLAALPSLIMFLGFRYMPESPRWLVMEGRHEEALVVLQSIRESDHDANEELQEIINVCALMVGPVAVDGSNHSDANSDDLFEDDLDDLGLELNTPTQANDFEELSIDPPLSDNRPIPSSSSSGTEPLFTDQVKEMLAHPPTLRALKLGCGIMILQQLSGINTVMYYAASIYQMSGFDGKI
jgi:MFS family permease